MSDELHELRLKVEELSERVPSEGEIRHLRRTDHSLHVGYQELKEQLADLNREIALMKGNINTVQMQVAQMQLTFQQALSALGRGSTDHGDSD